MKKAKSMASTLSIIIPIYNEAATVKQLLEKVYSVSLSADVRKEMVLVVSPSTDATEARVKEFLREHENSVHEIKVIFQNQARGKGNAVREGLKSSNGDIVMIQDADLEYDVGDYNDLLAPILNGKCDFVLGSRHLSAGNWKIRNFAGQPVSALVLNLGGFLFHLFFNIMYGQRLSDPTTMYKVFRRKYLSEFELTSNRFDFDFELLAKLLRAGAKPLEIPVSYSSRDFKEGKKIRPFSDPISWIIAIIKFRFSRLK
jgi:glycosyltransferase involved in cell wall biosynthesis